MVTGDTGITGLGAIEAGETVGPVGTAGAGVCAGAAEAAEIPGIKGGCPFAMKATYRFGNKTLEASSTRSSCAPPTAPGNGTPGSSDIKR